MATGRRGRVRRWWRRRCAVHLSRARRGATSAERAGFAVRGRAAAHRRRASRSQQYEPRLECARARGPGASGGRGGHLRPGAAGAGQMQLQRMGQQRARARAGGAAAVNKQPGKKCAWMEAHRRLLRGPPVCARALCGPCAVRLCAVCSCCVCSCCALPRDAGAWSGHVCVQERSTELFVPA